MADPSSMLHEKLHARNRKKKLCPGGLAYYLYVSCHHLRIKRYTKKNEDCYFGLVVSAAVFSKKMPPSGA